MKNILGEILQKKSLSRYLWLFVFLFFPLVFGLATLVQGRDINWDLKNYHYYNAYAFLEDRLGYDIAPAQLQTYFNPILDLPFYVLANRYHSSVVGFILGFVHGVNISLLFMIYWNISLLSSKTYRFLAGFFTCIAAAIAPGFLSELGNTMNDNLTSLFVFMALILSLVSHDNSGNNKWRSQWQVAAAGLVMGLGVGLKPTLSVYAVGLMIALITLYSSWPQRIRSIFIYGLFGVCGGIISSGFWWWELYTRFGNPTLPFYNQIFRSPVIAPISYVDTHFFPNNAWEYFLWPFLFSWDSYRVNPLKFTDLRFAILYTMFICWFILVGLKKLNLARWNFPRLSETIFLINKSNFLLLFFCVTYILWMIQSSNYRFLIPLELLVPICFQLVLVRIIESRRIQMVIIFCTITLVFFTFKPFDWGRLDWTKSYFEINTSRFESIDNVLVVMLGGSPTAYVIPEFPKDYRFVHAQSNLIRSDSSFGFDKMVKEVIKNHQGPIYILFEKKDTSFQMDKSLIHYGLQPKLGKCVALKVNTPDEINMCKVKSMSQNQ